MEKLKVHICPVGFEYQRILRGLKAYPCNLLYLLQSEIKESEYKKSETKYGKDKEIVNISQKFVSKIKKTYEKIIDVEVRDCSFIRYTKCIKNLSEVIYEIFELEKKNSNQILDKIWINIGTSSKLFATAAMILASFMPDVIKLFYVSSGNYTINLLFDQDKKREEIAKIYEKNGLTYGEEGYEIVDVPVIQSVQLSEQANRIICELLKHTDTNNGDKYKSKWVSFLDLLDGLGEKMENQSIKRGRAIKMKYYHHSTLLEERNLIITKIDKREKFFRLTREGKILALIAKNLIIKRRNLTEKV